MRKALLAAVMATLSIVPLTSNAADTLTVKQFHIDFPVPITASTGGDVNGAPVGAPCATGGFDDPAFCQKSTYARVARCLYLTDPATAQDSSGGKFGYVFQINALQVRGTDKESDNDNRMFDLVVTNKVTTNTPGAMDTPDVDVAFYADLGVCASDVEAAGDVYIPVGGLGPTQLQPSFLAKTIHNGLGDETGKLFPSGAYHPQSNPTLTNYASSYYAIVTIVGGIDADITLTCKGHGPISGGPSVTACPTNNWFVRL